ncbi:DUF4382 domain-containing protein [Flavivirga rizhaonensis]|uniref:DUF4382 domain-containing protein n=1 Tax=Flavivirga rizhaonensis TaxID=2559571 RepID=A0A4V3P4K3_9FLAO|nr:DUF4382 domain-containing protein [Flavivirga rizhaonensis]TGV01734.1 DUF4382 domain-containing protein [Flavivirga rizhaonensis]
MRTLNKLKLSLFSLILIFVFGCNSSESNNTNLLAPTISIKLVDESGDFEEVNVEVVDVLIKMDDNSDDDNGWISLNSDKKVINLLDLTGGVHEVLVDRFPIPTGTLKQIRLVLGDNNTIVIKNDLDVGETHDLKTPSGQQSGLKLKVDALIEEGFTYDFVLDFDVDKSVIVAGKSGNINLKPVMRVTTEVSSGIIEGSVLPADESAVASVIDTKGTSEIEDDEVISAYTNYTGDFALWGVPTGTYEVVLTPVDSNSKYKVTTVSDVEVVNGEITVIEPAIQLALKVGAITGKILNENVEVTASVIVDGAEVQVNTNQEGVFLLENIPIGVYKITLTPADGFGLTVTELNNEEVKEDQINDLGNITLPEA